MPHFMIILIPYINLWKPFLDKKKCLFFGGIWSFNTLVVFFFFFFFFCWPFKCSFSDVALLCMLESTTVPLCLFIVCVSSLFLLVPREGCASWLCPFLGIFNCILIVIHIAIQTHYIQSILVISQSKGLSEIVRMIRTTTYQICRMQGKK